MRNGKLIAYILIGAVTVLFAFVGFETFKVRTEINSVYPEYSSFRADPKGYRILFETLSQFDTLSVERFVRPLADLPSGPNKILLLAGLDPSSTWVDQDRLVALNHWLGKGGTLIISLKDGPKIEANQEIKPGPDEKKNGATIVQRLNDWGLKIFQTKLPLMGPLRSGFFPQNSSWACGLHLEPTQREWEILATVKNLPVVLRREYAGGELVILANSDPLSNSALAYHRNTELVSWLFPLHSTVIFDETHFGIVEHPSLISLARRYGLDGAFVAIVLLAILYLWASRYSLKPVRIVRTNSEVAVAGAGANEILVNLLRRSLPAKDLCATCLQIWKQKSSINPIKQARLESALNSMPPDSSPVERYNQIVKSQHS